MRIAAEGFWTVLFGCLGAAAWIATPASWHAPIVWSAGGLIAAAFVGFVVWASWRRWRFERTFAAAPASPMGCPACGQTEHDYKSQGLWDGRDRATGRSVGGCFGYGVCKACGTRWGQWDGRPPYVCPDDEWAREIEEPAARRAEQLRRWTEHRARRTGPKPIDY